MICKGKLSFWTCYHCVLIQASHLISLATYDYPSRSESSTFWEALDPWLLCETLDAIGNHTYYVMTGCLHLTTIWHLSYFLHFMGFFAPWIHLLIHWSFNLSWTIDSHPSSYSLPVLIPLGMCFSLHRCWILICFPFCFDLWALVSVRDDCTFFLILLLYYFTFVCY